MTRIIHWAEGLSEPFGTCFSSSVHSLLERSGAVFDGAGVEDSADDAPYRYLLWRENVPDVGRDETIGFVMLNPSTATHLEDDPTIRRCRGFARAWGYSQVLIGNVYAYRSTDPKALKVIGDPVGPYNDYFLERISERSGKVVVAWGRHAKPERARLVAAILRSRQKTLWCLGTNDDGSPKHPLYLARSTPLVSWEP